MNENEGGVKVKTENEELCVGTKSPVTSHPFEATLVRYTRP